MRVRWASNVCLAGVMDLMLKAIRLGASGEEELGDKAAA
jgi:hypothetical protein